ncbi:MAG: EVE domain-containing protein [Rhodobacteraceae bacterium]|nr:EVE domain-containing protein [Paracoccaceae bacterium]
MAPRFWVGVVAADHIEIAKAERVCAFTLGKETAVAKLSPGDRFVIYSPKTGFGEGETVQAFTALGTVGAGVPYEMPWAGTESNAWVRDAKYADAVQTPIKPMLEDLSFITNPRFWGMAFRRSLFEIGTEDFEKIEKAMAR